MPRTPVDPARLTEAELLERAVLRRAAEARRDLASFYSFVMRHETNRAVRLTTAPHQRVMFSFVDHHDEAVIRLPISTGKTFGMTAMAMWLLGNDVTQRGAVVSKAQGQSQKVVGQVADYIVEPYLNPPLRLVFPWLRKSPRSQDPWTQTQLVVERPPGIRDPSLRAVGVASAIAGARLSWLVADDVVDEENSATPDSRAKVNTWFDAKARSRLDPTGSKGIVCNTPWHREDLTFHLENDAGWPTLTMDIYGYVRFTNARAAWVARARDDLIRPSRVRDDGRWWRLSAFDPDPEERTPLWPERYSAERIDHLRRTMLPHEFARVFLCSPFDEDAARCQREWVESCKVRGLGLRLVDEYRGGNPTYTGVDLAVGTGQRHDKTVLFTFELLPDRSRRILDIESGRWQGPIILRKIIEKADRYGSLIAVENNAGQDWIRQFALEQRRDLRVRSHYTGAANKRDVDFGVESVFSEIKNGAWIIPCDHDGSCHPEVERWIEAMLTYQPPPAHTADELMACWIGREAARRGGGGRDPKAANRGRILMASSGDF